MNVKAELWVDNEQIKMGLADDGDGPQFFAVYPDAIPSVDAATAITGWLAGRGLEITTMNRTTNTHLGQTTVVTVASVAPML